MRRPALVAVGLAALAFAVLAVLVAAGALTSLDQFAVDHLMPGLAPGKKEAPLLFDTVPLADIHGETTIQILVDVFALPASAAVSGLIVAFAAWTLRRRGATTAAAAWVAAWLVANAAEVLTKTVLERPPLGVRHARFATFEHAFPSGHAARGLLVAALCAWVWPATRWYALAWIALTLPALVVAGFHTPSDVVGGTLLAVIVVGAAVAAARRRSAA